MKCLIKIIFLIIMGQLIAESTSNVVLIRTVPKLIAKGVKNSAVLDGVKGLLPASAVSFIATNKVLQRFYNMTGANRSDDWEIRSMLKMLNMTTNSTLRAKLEMHRLKPRFAEKIEVDINPNNVISSNAVSPSSLKLQSAENVMLNRTRRSVIPRAIFTVLRYLISPPGHDNITAAMNTTSTLKPQFNVKEAVNHTKRCVNSMLIFNPTQQILDEVLKLNTNDSRAFASAIATAPSFSRRKRETDSTGNKRLIPSFIINSTDAIISRKRRIAPLLGIALRYSALGAVMAGAGIATTAVDAKIRDNYLAKHMERLSRRTIDCSLNNFGCIDEVCWSNCGPRINSADWCLTRSNVTAVTAAPKPTAVNDVKKDAKAAASKPTPPKSTKCSVDSDCNPCWSCIGSCIMDGMDERIAKAKIHNFFPLSFPKFFYFFLFFVFVCTIFCIHTSST